MLNYHQLAGASPPPLDDASSKKAGRCCRNCHSDSGLARRNSCAAYINAREVRNQAVGSRAAQRSASLAWKELIELYGHEDVLREQIEQLKAVAPHGNDELLQLAEKYISGWRPEDSRRD